MGKRHTAFVFVALMLSSSLMGIAVPSNDGQMPSFEANEIFLEDAFVGFSIGDSQEVWNQTPFPSIAVPQGFDFLSVYDYSDVAVLINNNSEESRTIGWAFVTTSVPSGCSFSRIKALRQRRRSTGTNSQLISRSRSQK